MLAEVSRWLNRSAQHSPALPLKRNKKAPSVELRCSLGKKTKVCKTQRPGTMHSGLNRIPPWLFQFQGSTESPFCGVRVAEKLASPSSMWLTAILPRKRSQQLSQVGSYTKSLGFAWLPDYGKRLTSLLPSMGTSHSYQLF